MLADRYELGHEIGRGGMGSVWLGHDTVLGRPVAIKQIGMAPGGGAPDFDRAEREAHLAARVNHQNVVAVFDLVDDGDHQWLIMEHVDGPTLAGLVAERGPLDPEDLAPLVEQVAGALAAAHEHGIVHRDVKPSNILLTHDGVAKLSDFGVARAQADASLTQTGLVTGSPAYLAPEVAMGRTASAASDVWSLGASVFHALAGRAPYEVGDNVLGAMYRIVNEPPPRLRGGGRLAPVVEAMMQHDPDARPTMAEVERTVLASAGEVVPGGAHAAPSTSTLDLEDTQGFPAVTEEAEPTPTSAFRPLAAPVAAAVSGLAQAASPGTREHGHRAGQERTRQNLLLAGAVAAAIIVVGAFALVVGGDDPDTDQTPRAEATTSESTSPAAEEEAPTEEAEGPTEDQLEGFASDYLTAASNDPEEGFALLTPSYQEESGGLEGYEGFWGDVSNLAIQSVAGDTDDLTVSYTYAYDFDGDRRTEDVTLQLEQSGDSFLIAGAT